jgi:hypothetical protein
MSGKRVPWSKISPSIECLIWMDYSMNEVSGRIDGLSMRLSAQVDC